MAGAIASLKQSQGEIERELDQLERAVTALRSQWSGEAQGAYDRSQRLWHQNMAELNATLWDMTQLLERFAESHKAAEAKVIAQW